MSDRKEDVPETASPPNVDPFSTLHIPVLGAGDAAGTGSVTGMGAVLRARDRNLNRDLALKVLHARYRKDATTLRRFIEEAQIGGQLQHPGLVPIYEVGALVDGRPFFALKLVKGRTLAKLLGERSDPKHDLPRFLSIFEQVCQTVAYVHSRRVIHRDLKPAAWQHFWAKLQSVLACICESSNVGNMT